MKASALGWDARYESRVPFLMAWKKDSASAPLEPGKASTLCATMSVCLRRGSVASWKRRANPFGWALALLSEMLGRPVADGRYQNTSKGIQTKFVQLENRASTGVDGSLKC